MFCLKCGSQQADDVKFCGVCGTGLARVGGPQSEPSASVSSGEAPSVTTVSCARGTASVDAHLTVDEWAVTCTPPDSDGDVRFEAKVRGEYQGTASAHVARLFWIAFDPSGSIPLLQGDNTLTQDIDDEDSVEIEAGGYGKLGEGIDPAACQVQGQVVLYPGEKQAPWTIPLPEAGQTGGKGPAWPDAGAEVTGWRITCSESSEESASYTLFILVRNTNTFPLAAVTFRVRVKNRKGDVWSTDHLTAEHLAPGEMRVVEMSLYASEHARSRKGALAEVVAIVSRQEIVSPLLPVQPVAQRPEPESDDADEDEASNGESPAGEHSDNDTGGDAVTKEHNLDVVAEEARTMAKRITRTKAPGRPALFTFSRQVTFNLERKRLATFCSRVGVSATADLVQLAQTVQSGWRDDENDSAYRAIDEVLLPHLKGDVFFANFSAPELIFARPVPVVVNLGTPARTLRSCRVVYFAVWDLDAKPGGKSIEIAVEASFLLNVVEGVDIEHPYECGTSEIEDQFRECRNMFNFSVVDFEYDDEGLDHDWRATLE